MTTSMLGFFVLKDLSTKGMVPHPRQRELLKIQKEHLARRLKLAVVVDGDDIAAQ